jgi:hypothetical protein
MIIASKAVAISAGIAKAEESLKNSIGKHHFNVRF